MESLACIYLNISYEQDRTFIASHIQIANVSLQYEKWHHLEALPNDPAFLK